MILWAIFVLLLIVGLVVLPRRRDRFLVLLVLVVISFMAGPPLLTSWTSVEHNAFRRLHLDPMKQLLASFRKDIMAGRTNAVIKNIDMALSEWDELQTRGTNRTVRMIWDKIETISPQDDPEFKALNAITSEAACFFSLLKNAGALPQTSSNSVEMVSLSSCPPTSLTKYPVKVLVDVPLTNPSAGSQQYFIEKTSTNDQWRMTQGWSVSTKGERLKELALPEKTAQALANQKLPAMLAGAVTTSSLSTDKVNARELPYWADPERGLFYFQTLKPQQCKDDAIRTVETSAAVAKMSRQDAIRIWRSQQATVQERQDAACSLVTNGTPMRDVVAVLGTNYNIFRPFSMFRIDLTDPSHPRDLGLMKTCGIMYRFGEESVDLRTTANISADPVNGMLTGIGFSQPIVARTNADDEIDVKIENVPVSASHPSYREWLQQRRHTSRFREDGDPDDELNGLALPVRTVEVEEIVDKGITPPLGQDTREKALIDDTKSTLGQALINDAK